MPRVRLDQNYWRYAMMDELKGHTQTEIAEAIGVSQPTVSNKLKTMNFTLPEVVQMNRKLGINIRKVVDLF